MAASKEILFLYDANKANIAEWVNAFKLHIETTYNQLSNVAPLCELISFQNIQKEVLRDAQKIVVVLTEGTDLQSLALDNASKILLVLPFGFPVNGIPVAFGKLPTFNFYDTDPETGIFRSYLHNENEVASLYWDRILDVTVCLTGSDIPKVNEKTIYVAETTAELFPYRNAICSELIHRGFDILPKHFLCGNGIEISQQITEYLDQSFMSVHIIGDHYGQIIHDQEMSLSELQCRLAAKKWRLASNNPGEDTFQRIVWFPPHVKASDERQRRFMENLRIEDKDDTSEALQVPLEDLKAVLRDRIGRFRFDHKLKQHENLQSVYIIHEPKDREKIQTIENFLQQKNITVLKIDTEKDSNHIISRHLDLLSIAGSVIIYDNACSRFWINSKLKDIVKAPGYGRNNAFVATAILSNQPTRYKTFDKSSISLVLDGTLSASETLKPLLEQLNIQ